MNAQPGQHTDIQALMQKLLELQDALLQAQEQNIILTAQARELDRIARDHEDLRLDLENQAVLLADKTRENKYLHQELSRMSTVLHCKLTEMDEFKAQLSDVLHQLKTCQSERDLLAIMLTEAESAMKSGQKDPRANSQNWIKILKGKQS